MFRRLKGKSLKRSCVYSPSFHPMSRKRVWFYLFRPRQFNQNEKRSALLISSAHVSELGVPLLVASLGRSPSSLGAPSSETRNMLSARPPRFGLGCQVELGHPERAGVSCFIWPNMGRAQPGALSKSMPMQASAADGHAEVAEDDWGERWPGGGGDEQRGGGHQHWRKWKRAHNPNNRGVRGRGGNRGAGGGTV